MRKLYAILLSLSLILTALAFPSVVAADSIGTCQDLTAQTHQSGEVKSGFPIRGVYGEVYLATAAGACAPDDNMGINSAAVQIGIHEAIAGGFVTMGIMQCNTGDSSWPSSLCDNRYNLYIERHGSTFWDYQMYWLGPVASGNIYDLQISYGCTNHATEWCFFFDGTLRKAIDMGSALKPTMTTLSASWQAETKDRGDGLGNNVNGQSSGIGRIQYQRQDDRLWWLKSVGSACDSTHAQHRCVPNGSYGFYTYTVN